MAAGIAGACYFADLGFGNKLPNHKSSGSQPGEKFKKRIIPVPYPQKLTEFSKLRKFKFRFVLYLQHCSRSSTDRIMVSGTIDMSSNLVGSTKNFALCNDGANVIKKNIKAFRLFSEGFFAF